MVASYEKYAEMRDRRGLRDIEVADRAELSRSAISNWKHSRAADLKVSSLAAIASVLDCRIEDLLEEKGGG